MFFILSKLFAIITDPAFWIVACFVVAFLLKKRRWKRILFFSGIGLFLLLGNGFVISWVEQGWVRSVIKPLPVGVVYEYALIQGGFGDYNTLTKKTQVFEEAERLIEPIRLYREGRVKKLFISGDGTFCNNNHPESVAVFYKYMATLGVPENDIVLESQARNTRQGAIHTREMLGPDFNGKNSLIVTSATHMKRALKCYQKEGMEPVVFSVSVPVPYQMDISNFSLVTYHLYRWQKMVHEWVGMVTYWVAGYI